MAGQGERFLNEGFDLPKPLIPVYGKPMIELVIKNLTPLTPHRFIFLVQESIIKKFNLNEKLKSWASDSAFIRPVYGPTEGAACTVLLARDLIENNDPLLIANCDQLVDFKIDEFLDYAYFENLDGLILTFKSTHPKWSYIKAAEKKVVEVAEKKVISDEATVGLYFFATGQSYVHAAETMIQKNIRTHNEFYVAPTYNILIERKKLISFFNVGSENNGMYGLGTPEDLRFFLSLKPKPKVLDSCGK